MAEYTQRGKRKCPACKTETSRKTCPSCGRTTTGIGDWTVRFRTVEDNKVVYKRLSGFATKKDAEQGLQKYVAEHKQEKLITNKMSYMELKGLYMDYTFNEVKESTFYDKQKVFPKFIDHYFETKDIYNLSKDDILNWWSYINQCISERTKKHFSWKYKSKIRGYLLHFLTFCETMYDIPNIMARLPVPKSPKVKPTMEFYTLEEFKKFDQETEDNLTWNLFFKIQYYMGFRVGETCALRDQDVNLKKKIITINKSLSRKTIDHSPYKITEPKNLNSYRDVEIPNVVLEKLEEYLLWKKKQGLASDFLFGGSVPISEQSYSRANTRYAKSAELKRIRIHDYRHSNASLLISLGANVLLVCNRLGHGTPEETLNTYAKLFPNSQHEITEKLNSL